MNEDFNHTKNLTILAGIIVAALVLIMMFGKQTIVQPHAGTGSNGTPPKANVSWKLNSIVDQFK